MSDKYEAPEQDDKSRVTRRGFVRMLGIGAGAVGMGTGLARRTAVPSDGDPDPAQWVMVIDLARCDGCGDCTKACQTEHFTGDQEWITVFSIEHEDGTTSYLPRPCMHCENAPCVNVCPVGATFRDDHGTILIDHDRCVGCRLCMAACPYGARSFNWGEPENPPSAALARYSPQYPVPHRKGTVEKCMFCAHNARDGKLPACAQGCSMNAIWFGDLERDLVTNGAETAQLSWLLRDRNGFRLKEELGTRPRVWYLPGHGQDAEGVPPL